MFIWWSPFVVPIFPRPSAVLFSSIIAPVLLSVWLAVIVAPDVSLAEAEVFILAFEADRAWRVAVPVKVPGAAADNPVWEAP